MIEIQVMYREIFNFPGLRPELERLRHSFRMPCDTKAIMHAYKQWGREIWSEMEQGVQTRTRQLWNDLILAARYNGSTA